MSIRNRVAKPEWDTLYQRSCFDIQSSVIYGIQVRSTDQFSLNFNGQIWKNIRSLLQRHQDLRLRTGLA
jgi:hypothetical protein